MFQLLFWIVNVFGCKGMCRTNNVFYSYAVRQTRKLKLRLNRMIVEPRKKLALDGMLTDVVAHTSSKITWTCASSVRRTKHALLLWT
jgi:hypothetical protein